MRRFALMSRNGVRDLVLPIVTRRLRRTAALPRRRSITSFADSPSAEFRVAIGWRSEVFSDYGERLLAALADSGATTVRLSGGAQMPVHAVVLVGVHKYRKGEMRLLGRQAVVCGIQTEQLTSRVQGARTFGSRHVYAVTEAVAEADIVVDWHESGREVLRKLHPHVVHIPHGGYLDWATGEKRVRKEHDVLFLGTASPTSRRGRILAALQRQFSFYPRHQGIWGEEKLYAMDSSRILLNLHYEASLVFESPRFFEALSRGMCVLSEGVANSHPLREGIDFVPLNVMNMASVISDALDNEPLRLRVANAGQQRALEFSLQRSARVLLQNLVSAHHMIAV